MYRASLLLLLVACAPKPPPSDPPKTLVWNDAGAYALDPTQPTLTLSLSANGCPQPTRVAVAIDADGEERVVDLPFNVTDGAIVATLGWLDAWVDRDECQLTESYRIRAIVGCTQYDERRTDARDFTVSAGLTPKEPHVPNAARFYRRPTDEAPTATAWRQDGAKIIGKATLTNAGAHPAARLVTDGATHSYVTSACTVFCPPLRLLVSNVEYLFNTELVLAVPRDATGEIDARTAAYRIAVPGRIVDLAFSEGNLVVLSEQNGVVLLSTYPEAMLLMTDKTLLATPEILPYARAHGFFMQADATLIAMLSKADGSFVTYTARAMGTEVNTTPCPGSSNVPVPYPNVGGTSSGGTVSTSSGFGGSTAGGITSSVTSGASYPMTSTPAVYAEGMTCVKTSSVGGLAVFDSGESGGGMTPLTFTGGFRAGIGVTALVFAASDGRNAVRLDDGTTPKWLTFPSDGRLSPAIRGLAFSPDSSKLFVTTTRGFHVFQWDGTWLSGVSRLPRACGAAIGGRFEGNDLIVELGDRGFLSRP